MAKGVAHSVAHSLADTSSEYASAAAYSAFCYHIRKHVSIVAVVMAIRKLSQVQWQVGFAHIVERAHDATFQQAPKVIEIGCMDIPSHVFAFVMAHGFMGKRLLQTRIAAPFVRRNQRDVLIYSLFDKRCQGGRISVFDNLRNHISFASDCANQSIETCRGGPPARFARRAASACATRT